MPVLPFKTDADVVKFAKAFLDEHHERFRKDIDICLRPDAKSHAYFPALITCIAFAELLSGLYAGKLDDQPVAKTGKTRPTQRQGGLDVSLTMERINL